MAEIIALAQILSARGHAYVEQGHVLFHVPSYPEYGRLSGRRSKDMIAGARVEVAPYKRDPRDFVLWHKGGTSGLTQHIIEMRIEDDQDAVWLRVQLQAGTHSGPASCHVGYRSCFYRVIERQSGRLQFVETRKTFDPAQVCGDIPNPTVL